MTRLSRQSDPSRLGTVEDVNGASVSVKLAGDSPSGLLFVRGEGYRVGQVGGFVRIPAGYVDLYGIISQVGAGAAPGPPEQAPLLGNRWLRVELVGEGRRGLKFERGISQYPSIGDSVHVVTESDLRTIYAPSDEESYVQIGKIASAESIKAYLDLNKLISRHSAVVGSTGSGKSTAVASLLHSVSEKNRFPRARVVLLDLHGEYASCFSNKSKVFRVGADITKGEKELHIPYWALTSDEFVSISMGNVTGVPFALLQELLLNLKKASKPAKSSHGLDDKSITVDTPLPFSVKKLWYELYTIHCETHSQSSNQNQTPATRVYAMEGDPPQAIKGDAENLIRPKFAPEDKASKDNKVYLGLHNKLPRAHIELLENRLRDPRMRFLFAPGDWAVNVEGESPKDLDSLLDEWIGCDAPISVFDLSGIPPNVVDDLVGAVLRILFDALFWGRKEKEGARDRPLLLVLEEAHLYVGKESKGRAAAATRRIAKEGRKYGVGLMLVSQRPSEIDTTILSQCGTLASLRLTNENDRGQVTSCASDNMKGLFSMLPILKTGEALIVGESVNMPIRAMIDLPPEGCRPESEDPLAVVPHGPNGLPLRPGGWNDAVSEENYQSLVAAWRLQSTNGKASISHEKLDGEEPKKG